MSTFPPGSFRPTSSASTPPPPGYPSPVTFDDLVADLVWPKLLRAGSLAVRPSRIALGLVWLIGALAILWVADLADQAPGDVLGAGVRQILSPYGGFVEKPLGDDTRDMAGRKPPLEEQVRTPVLNLHEAFLGAPADFLYRHPFVAILGIPILIAWTALFGGAISRSAASDFCLGRAITWPEALGFALSRWKSLFGAIVLPLVLLWIIAFGMAVGGLLLRVPVLNMVAGFLWFLFLIGGLIGAAIIITYALGHTMLVPAVACEGTDAIDAVQHAYAYVFARPLRLLIYTAILVIQAFIVLAVVFVVVLLTAYIAAWSASTFAGLRGQAILIVVARDLTWIPWGSTSVNPTPTGTEEAAVWMIKFWCMLLMGLAVGAGVSLYWTSWTLLYLAMRRIVDGQDMHELWSPTPPTEGTSTMRPAPAGGVAGAAREAMTPDAADDT